MLQLTFKKTLCSAPSKNSGPLSTALTTKGGIKASLKDMFTKKKLKNDDSYIPSTTALTTPDSIIVTITTPETPNVVAVIEMDPEVLKAFNEMFEALHDLSILDARRHQRYALFPPVIAETPTTKPFSTLDVVQPRCRRSLVLYEIPAASLLYPSPLPIEPAPTTTCIEASSSEELIPDAPRVMNIKDIQILRFLGEGTSGKVYYVKDRVSKVKSALKVVPKNDKNEYTLSVVIQERFIAESLSDSPWFADLWAAWHDDANLYIAMTAYPTDLDSEMIRCGVIEPKRARFYMAELIIALTELHSRGIIHRDVKAPNILIDREGHIVLTDFGLSKDFGERPNIAERVYQPYWPFLRDESPTSETEPRDPEELYFVAWDYRGSELEMAPEIHLHQPYAFGVDFWSAAVVLYWMLTGRPPWYEVEEEYENGTEEDVKPLPVKIAEDPVVWDEEDNVDEDTKDFLEKMLAKNPKRRLMISYEMPNHPYFAGLNWTLMEERRISAPWIPEREVCHAYEPTSPVFKPGLPFPDEDSDPYPEFTFMSAQAASRVVVAADDDTESDSESDSSTVTDVEIMCVGSYEDLASDGAVESVPSLHRRGLNENETRTLISSKSVREEMIIKEAWDVSIVNRPSTTPCGPGPKLWLNAHDLRGIHLAAPSVAVPVLSLPVQDNSIATIKTSPSMPRVDACASLLLQDVHSSPARDAPLLPYAIPHQSHMTNSTGVLFKMKTWLTGLWRPSRKKGLPPER